MVKQLLVNSKDNYEYFDIETSKKANASIGLELESHLLSGGATTQ